MVYIQTDENDLFSSVWCLPSSIRILYHCVSDRPRLSGIWEMLCYLMWWSCVLSWTFRFSSFLSDIQMCYIGGLWFLAVHSGVCPLLPNGVSEICTEGCSTDTTCAGHEKCCSNGCGHVCMTATTVTQPAPTTNATEVAGTQATGKRKSCQSTQTSTDILWRHHFVLPLWCARDVATDSISERCV